MHLHPVHVRVVAELRFKARTGFHVGGLGLDEKNMVVTVRAKDGQHYYLIPGSTWKGIFRAVSEKVVPHIPFSNLIKDLSRCYQESSGTGYFNKSEPGFENVVETVISEYENYSGKLPLSPKEVFERLVAGNDEMTRLLRENEISTDRMKRFLSGEGRRLLMRYLSMIYPVTSLYGAPGVAAKIRFFDTILRAPTSFRTSVGIDRKTLRSMTQHLFSIQTVNPNSDVLCRFVADNILPKTDEAKLLATTLETIRHLGLHVGGGKSRGLGYMTLNAEETVFRIIDLNPPKTVAEKLRALSRPLENPATKLSHFITWLQSA